MARRHGLARLELRWNAVRLAEDAMSTLLCQLHYKRRGDERVQRRRGFPWLALRYLSTVREIV